jgi:ankyrin repeat domain-containing protein 50
MLLGWASIRVFIRVQWEPFEARFGMIDSSLQHHLEVLLHSAQALQIRDADSERRRVQQKENRKHVIFDSFTLGDVTGLLLLSAVEERRSFLRWLSEDNFEGDHDAIYSKRHRDTGTWIIQERKFQQWLNDDASSLLWCFGKRTSLTESHSC